MKNSSLPTLKEAERILSSLKKPNNDEEFQRFILEIKKNFKKHVCKLIFIDFKVKKIIEIKDIY